MAKKTNIEGYTVAVFVPVREASDYWGHRKMTAEQARDMAQEIRQEIKRHLHNYSDIVGGSAIEIEAQSQDVCEHCGAWWTEKSDAYNGGCCDKDEAANPDAQEAA